MRWVEPQTIASADANTAGQASRKPGHLARSGEPDSEDRAKSETWAFTSRAKDEPIKTLPVLSEGYMSSTGSQDGRLNIVKS